VVADYLHDPEVAKAKDAKEALKIIVRKEQIVVNTALAELVGESYGAHSHTLPRETAWKLCKRWMQLPLMLLLLILLTVWVLTNLVTELVSWLQ
jgi:hypothetical protein